MAAGNTKFRAENGLDVVGGANVSGMLRVDGDLSVGGNLAFTLTTSGDLMPTSNQFFVGNTTNRWTIFALQGNFTNVDATATTTLNVATIATSVIPTANNKALGNTTSRWDFYGNNASLISANVGANVNISTTQLSVGNTTVNTTLTQTGLSIYSTSFATFNANSGVANTTELITTAAAHVFANGDILLYTVAPGNTAIGGLTSGSSYYMLSPLSNPTTTLFLSSTLLGSPINITAGINETGHTLTRVNSGVVANNTSVTVGGTASNITFTQNTLTVGNSSVGTINAFALNISGLVAQGNTTTTGFINVSSYGTFGNVVNATSFNSTGAALSTFANNVTITGVANVSANVFVGANVNLSPSQLYVGNTTSNAIINQTSLNIGTTTVNVQISSNSITLGNSTSGTANMFALNVGANVNVSTTQLSIGNATVNSVLTQNTLVVGNSTVGTVDAWALNIGTGNTTFRTDLLTIDGTNNRIGLKTGITSLSNSAVATITGNLEFSTISTGIRLQTSNASMNASIMVTGNTTNTRATFNTFDSGTGTVSGGFSFTGTNSTSTQALLDINSSLLQYKSGNVAHSGNFGIYDVNGTRIGP